MRHQACGNATRAAAGIAVIVLAGLGGLDPAWGYTVTGYVWQFQQGDTAPQRVEWDPVLNPGKVNFLTPITYSVGLGGPVGASLEVRSAFDRWNQIAGTANIRYRFVPGGGHITVQFVANPAGVPGEISIGASTSLFNLDSVLVLRTDRFNVDIPPVNTVLTDPIDQYDTYTVAIHEVGHDLGLGHRRNSCTTLTAQNFARGVPCPTWVPDPTAALEGLPVGTLVYNNPRRILTPDDIRGLRTLYSEPQGDLELVKSTFDKFSKRFHYEYRAINRSVAGSDYFLTRLEIPLPGILAESVETPAGFDLSPETGPDRIVWEATAGNPGISPGGNFIAGFNFNHPLAPQFGTLTTGFSLPNLALVGAGSGGDFDDPGNPSVVDLFHSGIPAVTIGFDPNAVIASTEGFIPQFFTADVPTLSEWGMIILSGLLLISLIYAMTRRRRIAPAGGGTHA